jgi:Pentapeptide repeats (8 copies)
MAGTTDRGLSALLRARSWVSLAVWLVAWLFGWVVLFVAFHAKGKWGWPPPLIPALSALGGFAVLLLWKLPKIQTGHLNDEERFGAENEARKTLAQIVGGGVVLAGLFFSMENLKVQQETLNNTREAESRSDENVRRGQITDRFTKAVDQLGAKQDGKAKTELRLGGIYALEQLAHENKDQHWVIMELLTTYVRVNSVLANSPAASQQPTHKAVEPSPDVQAALNVFGRRYICFDQGNYNLSYADLRGAYLAEAPVSSTSKDNKTYLIGTNLSKAYLMGADFRGADLQDSLLTGADLSGADLRDANITQEQLESARGDHSTKLSPRDQKGRKLTYPAAWPEKSKEWKGKPYSRDEKCPPAAH